MAEEKQSCAFRTSIGGQALIEGIMMRGPEKQAIVVRDQEGNLVEKVEDLKFIKDRYPVLGWPLIRGVVNFIDSLVLGMETLTFSAGFFEEEEEEESQEEAPEQEMDIAQGNPYISRQEDWYEEDH